MNKTEAEQMGFVRQQPKKYLSKNNRWLIEWRGEAGVRQGWYVSDLIGDDGSHPGGYWGYWAKAACPPYWERREYLPFKTLQEAIESLTEQEEVEV